MTRQWISTEWDTELIYYRPEEGDRTQFNYNIIETKIKHPKMRWVLRMCGRVIEYYWKVTFWNVKKNLLYLPRCKDFRENTILICTMKPNPCWNYKKRKKVNHCLCRNTAAAAKWRLFSWGHLIHFHRNQNKTDDEPE